MRKISIIVPVYKVERYIEKCLDTLINQTYQDIEIILVNDGSPDCCPSICDRYAQEYSNVIVIHKKNGGLSDARNVGITKASGEYIMFVDSDDYIDLDACEKIVPYIQTNVDVIVTDAEAEGKDIKLLHSGIINGVIYSGYDFLRESVIFGSIPMAAWLYIYKRSFLIENQLVFKKGIYHEDEEFTPRALLAAKSIINTGICYYHYVIHENSITTKKDKRENAKDFFETCMSLYSHFNNLNDKEMINYLKDMLVNKYLSIFQDGRLYQYGDEYLHKEFILQNAYRMKTKMKARLYNISPRLYWFINRIF